jgi:ATP-binding cassette subfamily B (MDR/TAP) protein 1
MYDAKEPGHISLDEQDMMYLNEDWVRSKVMGVTQSTCVLLKGRTVYENIVCAALDRAVTKEEVEEVEEACRAALIRGLAPHFSGWTRNL